MKWIALSSLCLTLAVVGCKKEELAPAPAQPKAEAPAAPKAPLIAVAAANDWCVEHGVPESQCTRCNAGLIDGFKRKGDWCAKHNLPDSQCTTCHPELKAKFEAMAPKQQAAKQ